METCAIMEQRFPEYDEWRTAEKSEQEEHWKRIKEFEGNPAGLLLFALEKLTGKKTEIPLSKPSLRLTSRRLLAPTIESKQRVGRNEPCPCGSGKKFKQCCLRKGGG